MPKAEVTLTVKLKDPQGTWENKEVTTYDEPQALTMFVASRIAKVITEGGIMDFIGPFEVRYISIAFDRFEEMHCKAVPLLIDDSLDVKKAVQSVEASSSLRADGTIPFRKVH